MPSTTAILHSTKRQFMKATIYVSSLIIFLLFGLGIGQVVAQGTVSGTVTDGNGDPVSGATVTIKALAKGAFSDEAGKFQIGQVPAGEHELSVTFLGYATQTIAIAVESGKTTRQNFKMAEEVMSTEEVLVIGYGTVRKRELVGSVSKIEAKDLNDIPGGSFETALQGKAPGIQVVQGSGVAGAGAVIRIRGIGSLSSGGDPLFVIDGIPVTQDHFINNDVNSQGGGINNNPLAFLNPNDIAHIEVLKDASAAAIYGSRGSNGVVLITTKRGQTGKPKFSFNSRVGLSEPTGLIDVLNSEQFLQIRQEAWENDGNVGRAPLPLSLDYADIEGVDTDWIDQVIRTGTKQEYNLSMTQGSKKLKTYIGVGYLNGESYQIGNAYQRANARANLDYQITEKMRVSLSTSIARGLNDRVRQGWAGGLGTAMTSALPIYPVKDANGDWFNIYGNPVAQEQLQDWKTREWRTINNLLFNYSPMEGLEINATGSFDYMTLGDFFLEDSLWTTNQNLAKGFRTRIANYQGNLTAKYDFKLPEDHKLNVMGGLEYQESKNSRRSEEYWGVNEMLYLKPDLTAPSVTTIYNDSIFRDVDRWRFASAFARLNYIYKDKFLVQLTYRRDGSSKFGANKRFGDFPAAGVGYILSEENFLKDNPVINFLKLKASWGLTGNADIDWRRQFPLYTFDVPSQIYNGEPVRYQRKLANPDLQWEVSNTFDAGIEVGLLNDRFTVDFTYYYRLTTDAIINTSIQASSGLDDLAFNQNVGTIENKGIELGIMSRNLVKAFKWTTRFNIAHNRNKVLDVGTATPDALDGGFGDVRAVPGEPVNTNFIVRWSHVDPATGHPVYLTRGGEETYVYSVVSDRVAAGNGAPDFTGGLTNEFSYRNFDLNFLLYFSVGGTIYDDAAKRHMGVVTDWNMRTDVFDRWRKPGDIATYPRLTMDMRNWGGNANFWQNNHSLWLEDASYMRLRTVSLGYNIKVKTGRINNIRVSFNGTNLWTLTNYRGMDPEVARERENPQQRNIGGTNVTYLTAPNEKTYTFGLKVDF